MEARSIVVVIGNEVAELTVVVLWVKEDNGLVGDAVVTAQVSHGCFSARYTSVARRIQFDGNIAIATRDERE